MFFLFLRADESERSEGFCKINDLLYQLVASETGPWGWRRGFAGRARYKYEMMDLLVTEVADLVRS
jgi:hypothetical protein